MIQLALMASGGGTTAEYVFRQCQRGRGLHGLFDPRCLIISHRQVTAADRLRDAGFGGQIYTCSGNMFGPERFGEILLDIFGEERIDWFAQYGWLPLTPEAVIKEYPGINQHPAPVPWFGGKGMYGRAPHKAIREFAQRVERPILTEATAQLVHPEFDQGERIACISYPVSLDCSTPMLQQALLPLEHQCQVEALLRIAAYGGKAPPPVESYFELLPGEEDILAEAKRLAIEAWPHG